MKKNIMLIMTDQQRYDTLGCYGNDIVSTPNLDNIANDGILFENSFRHSFSVCSLDLGTAYDMAIVRESLEFALQICKDKDEKANIQKYLDNLYPIQKGRHGICEYHKNYIEFEPGHRHFSPLYAFHPSNEIGYNSDSDRTQWVSDLF